jgi:hypothetical protein
MLTYEHKRILYNILCDFAVEMRTFLVEELDTHVTVYYSRPLVWDSANFQIIMDLKPGVVTVHRGTRD